jgi:Uma2 family endonuclease
MSTSIAPAAPPLRHGERLSREEFERRYEAMPDVKAELLDGVVYIMSSPVSIDHSKPHGLMVVWLGNYAISTEGVDFYNDTTIRLPDESEPQPDASLRILESHGGNSRADQDRFVSGAPELVCEVSRASDSYDRTAKKQVYRRSGVKEFILWRVENRTIDWFILRNDDYELLSSNEGGIIRSATFPGLWLDVAAMIRLDGPAVVRVLQDGINSVEHARFVEQLQQSRTTS